MHVAVTHQGEMGVDALRREGVGQGLIDGDVLHGPCWRVRKRERSASLPFAAAMGTGRIQRGRLPRYTSISGARAVPGARPARESAALKQFALPYPRFSA